MNLSLLFQLEYIPAQIIVECILGTNILLKIIWKSITLHKVNEIRFNHKSYVYSHYNLSVLSDMPYRTKMKHS